MKTKYRIITTLLLLVFAASCTDNFEEINTDPNRPKQVFPGVLLPQLQYKMVNQSIAGARSFSHEVMQMTAPRESAVGGLHRYAVTDNNGSGLWNNFYTWMTDVRDLYDISDRLNEDNYKAIALIYKSWGYSILTDAFGDIPYSEATSVTEGIYTPVFDVQKDIYSQILQDLTTANALLNDSKGLIYGGDLVYKTTEALSGGKSAGILRWKKFANSLRLRLLLRILSRDGEINVAQQINQILSDPGTYPVFTSNSDEAILRYPGTFPFFNPYFNARTLDWREGTYYTKFFIDYLNQTNDPRRAVWSTQVRVNNVNVYRGIESGYPGNTVYVVNANSSYLDALKTLPDLGIMMTYAEVEFIKAELALKGFTTGATPKAHYEKAIAASMTQWGVTPGTDYYQQSGVLYPDGGTTEDQLKQIMQQKYYALYFNDYQAWFEKRRTGYPELPRGSGIPAANQFPSRIPYPSYLQSLNAANLASAVARMGGDNSNIKVWWEK